MCKFLQARVANGGAIPKCSQLRDCYLFGVYHTERAALKEVVTNKQIALIVDKLSDSEGRFVLDVMAIFLDFVQFGSAVWEARQASKEQKQSKLQEIVVVPIFLNFCRVCMIQRPLLVSEKNEEVTESRKVQNILSAAIFLQRIVKFVIACNPGHKWEIKPKEIRRSFVNQRIQPMGRNFRRPGPVK